MSDRFILPKEQVFDSNGTPLAGAKLYFYQTGTTTPLDTYSDSSLSTPNANPVVADSAGRFSDIFMKSQAYKVILKDSSDTQVWSSDPVRSFETSSSLPKYGADSGSTDAYSITTTPAITSYTTGQLVLFKVNTEPTDASTLNVDGIGNIALKKNKDTDTQTHDFRVGQLVLAAYDGTYAQILSPVRNQNSNTPAMRAYLSSTQTVPNGNTDKVEFNIESYDTDSVFDTSTYKFTPGKIGWYEHNIQITWTSSTNGTNRWRLFLYKNGSATNAPEFSKAPGSSSVPHTIALKVQTQVTSITDYFEVYALNNDGSSSRVIDSGVHLSFWECKKLEV